MTKQAKKYAPPVQIDLSFDDALRRALGGPPSEIDPTPKKKAATQWKAAKKHYEPTPGLLFLGS